MSVLLFSQISAGLLPAAVKLSGSKEDGLEARDYIDSVINEEHLAQAQLDLARAASSMGCWERAEEAAQKSLDLATARSEARVRLAAEAVLEAITSERAVDIHQPPVDEVETSTEVIDLAVDFVLSLGGCVLVGV